jgi:C2 domain
LKQVLSAHYVDSEERGGFGAVRTVKLEEIGFHDLLPCPGVRDATRSNSGHDPHCFLNGQVDTDGATRVLVVSDNKRVDDRGAMQKHMSTIERQIRDEENRRESFRSLKKLAYISGATRVDEEKDEEGQHSPPVSHLKPSSRQLSNLQSRRNIGEKSVSNLDKVGPEMAMIEDEAKVVADFPEGSSITRRHQVIVEVLEATGLRPYEVTGFCNPYCEIVVKGRSKAKRSFFTSSKIRKSTYYIEKTLAPKWTNQIFVFDVPDDAANVTRGHSIQFRMRNFRFVGSHPYLGQTNVHLRSLRNQVELVGWYPLVGRTGRRELEDSQANWGRGSVKLRVQWVYTVPALLDYFLLLSERRLADLRDSVAGMNQQLEHLIETESLKKGLKDTFSIGRIPNLLGIRATQKQRLQQGIPRALLDAQEGTKKTKWKLGAMTDPLRQSRDNLMWLLYFQTAESRRSRRLGNIESEESIPHAEAPQMARERLVSIVEIRNLKDEVQSQNDHNSLEESGADLAASFASLQNASIEELYRSSMTEHRGGSGLGSSTGRRIRSLSMEDVRPEQRFNRDVLDFAKRARSGTYDGSIDGRRSLFEVDADLLATNSADEAHRNDAVNRLFCDGLVYHRNNAYFHKRHLSYSFRAALLETQGAAQSSFRLKSPHRVAPSMKQFRSWTAAQAILNDKNLKAKTKNSEIQICLLSQPESTISSRHVDTSTSAMAITDDQKLEETCHSFVLDKLQLPSFAPPTMQRRAYDRAEGIYLARNEFERACKRSLRAVLNPGGWLTIRPITALNLSDAFTGMHVKLRYGAESVNSQTVEARVTPSWASESPSNDDVSSSERTSTLPSTPVRSAVPDFQFSENDLQVYVEPQKTSGSLRLSIVGERMNQRTELGVLHIPLGAAISCCVECMEDSLETESDTMPVVPMYVRWFPLMSPKDSVAVDGDMGNSFKPLETEQLRDSLFTNYFTPCIKLALIWQPDQEEAASGARPPEMGNQCQQLKSPLTEKYFNADFARVSTSLIDSQRAIELFSLALSDIDVRYSMTKGKTRMGVVIGWIQVDHQDPKARESVVLAPTPVEHPQPTLQFLAVKDNLRSKGNIDSYEYIGVSLQELDLTVEEAFIFAVWEFIISVVRRREVKRKVVGGSTGNSSRSRDRPGLLSTTQFRSGSSQVGTVEGNPESTLYTVLFGDNSSGELLNDQRVYVEQLLLGFVKINLSYLKGKRGNWELTEGGEFITKSIDGLTQGLPEKMAITAGGLRLAVGRKRESQSEVLAKWALYTHDEDLWTDSGEGKSLCTECIMPPTTV